MARKSITGAQWEYLTALGEEASPSTDPEQASKLIDKAKAERKKPATKYQRKVATAWGVAIPDDATRAQATDKLYEFIIARRWVYSVLRKMVGAELQWNAYRDSGVADTRITGVVHEVLSDKELADAARSATRGSSFTGATWNRYTAKQTEASAFKRTESLIESAIPAELKKLRSSGCMAAIMLAPLLILSGQ